MERRKKFKGPDGAAQEGTEVGFRPEGEYFNEYLLDDGTVLRTKNVLVEVIRLDGVYDDEGKPIYAMKSNAVMVVSPPDHLLRDDH